MIQLSPRMNGLAGSPASLMRRKVQELRASGRDVIDLSSGDLDFPSPNHVIEAAYRAARRGETKYTNVDGTPELKAAVRRKFETRNDLAFNDDEVIVCNGSTQAVFQGFLATVSADDEVLVPCPYWSQYLNQARLAGANPALIACPQNNGFKLRSDDLRAAISDRTRWLVLNNPANPSGVVYSRDELAAIANVMLEHPDVWILEDNLYEDIVFHGVHTSAIAEVEPRLKPRTLVVGGVAKSYAMMGWRIGYAGGPNHLIWAMANIQSQTTSCASSISQAAAVAALSEPQYSVGERNATLAENRDYMVTRINACAGLSCSPPQGTFYLLICCSGALGKWTSKGDRIMTDRQFAEFLLDEVGVVVAVGEDFGLSPYIRGSFGVQRSALEQAMIRIERACASLS
jgi:aspartate aminotransferase